MERAAPQEGDPRLVRLRDPRHRPRRDGRPEEARRRGHRQRRVQARRPDRRGRRLPRRHVRVRPRPGQGRPDGQGPAVHGGRRRRRRQARATKGVSKVENPLDAASTPATSPTTAARRCSHFDLPGDEDAAKDVVQGPLDAVAQLAARASRGHGRRVRRRVRREGDRRGVRAGLPAGRVPLAPDHADHPAGRVRRARRRRPAAAARLHRRDRHDRPARPDQPAASARRVRRRASSCSSASPSASTTRMFYLRREMEERDAGRRLGGGAERRGRHLRPRGADLRLHRDGRDGGHVPGRQRRLRLVRHRHDHRRRRRGARLGDRAPRDAAFLSRKGWVEKGRVPWVAKRRHKTRGESRVWGAILDRVLKRPLRLGDRSPAACWSR